MTNTVVQASTTTYSTSSTASSVSTTSMAAATTTGEGGNDTAGGDPGLSTGAKEGIGVGAAVGAIALLSLIAFFLLRRRRRLHNSQVPELQGNPGAGYSPGQAQGQIYQKYEGPWAAQPWAAQPQTGMEMAPANEMHTYENRPMEIGEGMVLAEMDGRSLRNPR
jgi:LPXTG-motif cell wall-anchored protein